MAAQAAHQIQHRFRFRPRYKALALGTMAVGALLMGVGFVMLQGHALLLGGGATGVVLGFLYLVSPAWRLEVVVDDEALEVRSPRARRFRLGWDQVVEVLASPATRTCFVNGGHPETSLIVPGPGAIAPYDIEDKHELYELICRHVPGDRIREVELIEVAARAAKAGAQAGAASAPPAPADTNREDTRE